MESDFERLRSLIASRAVEVRPEGFVLASGIRSSLYIDLRRITQDPEGINLAGRMVLSKIREMFPEARFVGGLETGAIPISTAVTMLSFSADHKGELSAFWVRKKQKDHGLQNMVEGNLDKGGLAVIVEDTATTGGSSLQAVEEVRRFGAEVLGVIAVVDRGAAKNLEKAGVKFVSLFKEEDLAKR